MDKKQEKILVKKISGLFILQTFTLLFILYGLFFFYRDVFSIQIQDNPFIHIKKGLQQQENEQNNNEQNNNNIQNSSESTDPWFHRQFNHIYFFFDKQASHDKDFYNDLNFTCSEDIVGFNKNTSCSRIIPIESEPLCFEEQKIDALMTGSFPSVLGHLFDHDKIDQDSFIKQMSLSNKKSVIFGSNKKWRESFPFYFNQSNHKDFSKIQDVLEHTYEENVDFAIIEYEKPDQMKVDIQDLLDNLDHTKKTLVLLYQEQKCSLFRDRNNILQAYSTSGFQQVLTQKQLDHVPRQIDIASSLSILMGLPLPYENYGSPITDLYSYEMDEIQISQDQTLSDLFNICYHYFMTFESVVEYLESFYDKSPYRFSSDHVQYIQENQLDAGNQFISLQQDLVELRKQFENLEEQERDNKVQNGIKKTKKMTKIFLDHILETRLAIEQANQGQIYILIIGFLALLFTFSIVSVLMTSFNNIFGYIRNILSSVFQFGQICSKDFSNFLFSTLATFFFIAGSLQSRLLFKNESLLIVVFMFLYAMSLVDIQQCFQNKCRSEGKLFMFLLSLTLIARSQYVPEKYLGVVHVIQLVALIGVQRAFLKKFFGKLKEEIKYKNLIKINQLLVYVSIYLSLLWILPILTGGKVSIYINIEYLFAIQLGLLFINLGFIILFSRKGYLKGLSNTTNIIYILITLLPVLSSINQNQYFYIYLMIFIYGSIKYLNYQLEKQEHRNYQTLIILMLFSLVLQDSIIGSKELGSLTRLENNDKFIHQIFQLLLNVLQISIAPIITAFLIAIWLKIINTGSIQYSTLVDNKDEVYQQMSRFGVMFILCGLYTMRICIFILAIIVRNIKSETHYANYRILQEGFIFESISYIFLFLTLIIITRFSSYYNEVSQKQNNNRYRNQNEMVHLSDNDDGQEQQNHRQEQENQQDVTINLQDEENNNNQDQSIHNQQIQNKSMEIDNMIDNL